MLPSTLQKFDSPPELHVKKKNENWQHAHTIPKRKSNRKKYT